MVNLELLDLSQITLYGYTEKTNIDCVNALRVGIQQGSTIPYVGVERLSDTEYQILPECAPGLYRNNSGGHKRAIAHMKEGLALPVVVINDPVISWKPSERVRLEDIELVNDRDAFENSCAIYGDYLFNYEELL